ncbi:DUF1045 domain-containing protein [Litorisediminicola beolgyonensis]|uniref:DUF1045 domain-containing protein n=1 Tax=Litorisediminicola beolgyonensis TaxID=1173614 RepID=A0ABW3ZMT9_9RHOB
MSHTRYALYYLPPPGALASFGARWFGWDIASGCAAEPLEIEGREAATETPRRYGFHATLKPPFRLADGATLEDLTEAVADLATTSAPATCDGLELTPLGRFLALTPMGDTEGLSRIAASCVSRLDTFRAPPSEAELENRRARHLSARQEALLARWGYPHVMEEFRFHMTLTTRLPRPKIPAWHDTLLTLLPPLPNPFTLDEIALVGERPDGFFEEIRRFPLTG